MAGAGYRTFQSGEVLTSTNVQTYLMDQAVQVYSGTAARASAIPSPSTGMVAYSTATGLQVFNGSAWVDAGGGYGAATGGASTATATISGVTYTILTFTATGTLTNTKAGFFDFLAIGGGGATLEFAGNASGGGGAGQLVCGSIYLDANQTITIGAGASRFVYTVGKVNQAGNTTIAATSPFFVTALGNLITYDSTTSFGYVGGGLGGINGLTPQTITESTGLGYRGGASTANTNSGGGGGQSGRGGNGSSTTGGSGGAGFDISAFIGGSAAFRAQGGGGGGSVTGGAAATDGVAGTTTATANNGGANTGQGAGGGYGVTTNGNGGSGVVYIRFKA